MLTHPLLPELFKQLTVSKTKLLTSAILGFVFKSLKCHPSSPNSVASPEAVSPTEVNV